MARPWWVHSDGRPYDELDFGKTRVYDELDAREHDTKLERSAEQTIFRRALNRLKAAAGNSHASSDFSVSARSLISSTTAGSASVVVSPSSR